MLNSHAPGHVLDQARRRSGPNPVGSKLADIERLHLILLLGVMIEQRLGSDDQGAIGRVIMAELKERGMAEAEVLGMFPGTGQSYSPVDVANMIAVHPSLKHPYLD